MAGRHSKRGAYARISGQRGPRQAVTNNNVRISGWSRWRRASTPSAIPAPRLPGIDVVDALTKLAHRVSSDELLAGRQCGNYLALCGVRFPAASMVDPGRGQCPRCVL